MNSGTIDLASTSLRSGIESISLSPPATSGMSATTGNRVLVIAEDAAAAEEFREQSALRADAALPGRDAFMRIRGALHRHEPYAVAFVDEGTPETPDELLALDPDLQIVVCTSNPSNWRDSLLTKSERSDRLAILKKPFDRVESLQLVSLLASKWSLAREARLRAHNWEEAMRQHSSDLRRSQERITLLSQASNEAIWEWDLTKDEGWWNEGLIALFGGNEDDRKAGMTRWSRRLHPEDRTRVMDGLHRAIESGESTWADDYRFRRADGTHASVHARGQVQRDAAGRPLRIVGAMQDVSSRKQAEHERQALEVKLRHAQKMESIGRLAAGVAHEINTPMQFIGDNTRFLRDAFHDLKKVLSASERAIASSHEGAMSSTMMADLAATKRAADFEFLGAEIPKAIDQTIEGIERVSKIVRSMKEFAQHGAEQKTLLDVNKVVESTLIVCRHEWKYVAELETNFDAQLPMVPVLAAEFNQAILAIVVNAAQAIAVKVGAGSSDKGVISVSTRRGAGSVEVRIRDTGVGIPAKIRERIFEPFFSTKPAGQTQSSGLALAHAVIVEKHGGILAVESEEGVGSCFIVRLPLVDVTAPRSV